MTKNLKLRHGKCLENTGRYYVCPALSPGSTNIQVVDRSEADAGCLIRVTPQYCDTLALLKLSGSNLLMPPSGNYHPTL